MGTEGTVIHEGIHKYSSSVLRDEQIAKCVLWHIDYQGTSRSRRGRDGVLHEEGCFPAADGPACRLSKRVEVATNLAGRCGEAALAKAYFDGDFGPVKATLGAGWDAFFEHLERKDWAWLRSNGYR